MYKINFANTTKLGFWDFVIEVRGMSAPKLVSGDYKDLRDKIKSGELIDGVIVDVALKENYFVACYGRLHSWRLVESKEGSSIALGFQNSPDALDLDPYYFLTEDNEVIAMPGNVV